MKMNDATVEVFPYKILNDLSKKLKAAEAIVTKLLAEREALENSKNDEINKLKQQVSDLVYENNRYHLSISYCTVCTSDDEFSDTSLSDEVSIQAFTPVTTSLVTLEPISISPVPCSSVLSSDAPALSSIVPALTPSSVMKKGHAKTKMKRKDKTFISRMVKTLTRLETKYLTPEHKRKKRLFTRKKTSPIIPKEFDSIYHVLAAPEPDAVAVPDPFPYVRWSDVRFKPALPNPEQCPVHSCSPDAEFYVHDFGYLARPFGTLPGYKTSLGVVAVPITPVGGYVYCPNAGKWVLYAETRSSPSAGRGTRRGGTPPARRRRG